MIYIKTYNRPATAEEVSYYQNIYGGNLDNIERKDLMEECYKDLETKS